MQSCKRTTQDPLLKLFLEKYHLNLLSVPRKESHVGDLYVYAQGRTSSPGQIGEFLEPKLELPDLTVGEQMADVQGMVTDAVSFSNGLDLLEGFFSALGSLQMFQGIKTEYARQKAHSFQFSFLSPTRDSIDIAVLGARLIRHRFKKLHALVNEGNRYYLVTALAKSQSISVEAQTKGKGSVELDAKLMSVAKLENKVGMEQTGAGKLTFSGNTPLVFGVELYELTYDKEEHRLKLLLAEGAIKVRSGLGERTKEVPAQPAFLGDPQGEIFIELT